jgi:3-hydroxyisobutyrate dehydrogenase-like beta-hydroxyacid dehydrogenase
MPRQDRIQSGCAMRTLTERRSSPTNILNAKLLARRKMGFGVAVLITMFPNGKVVRDVLLGENGIARNLKAGMYLRLLAGYVTESRFRFSCN